MTAHWFTDRQADTDRQNSIWSHESHELPPTDRQWQHTDSQTDRQTDTDRQNSIEVTRITSYKQTMTAHWFTDRQTQTDRTALRSRVTRITSDKQTMTAHWFTDRQTDRHRQTEQHWSNESHELPPTNRQWQHTDSQTWQTDTQTDGHRMPAIAALCIASHGN